MRRFAAAICLFLPGLFLPGLAADLTPADLTGKPVVMDGDTLLFGEHEVTLYGVHAPLITQSCGATGKVWSCGWEAALQLEAAIGEHEVACVAVEDIVEDAGDASAASDAGDDATQLARCRAAGEDLAGLMIDAGFVVPDEALGGDYAARAAAAAERGAGIWSGPFVDPAAMAEKASCSCAARKQSLQETAAVLKAMREDGEGEDPERAEDIGQAAEAIERAAAE